MTLQSFDRLALFSLFLLFALLGNDTCLRNRFEVLVGEQLLVVRRELLELAQKLVPLSNQIIFEALVLAFVALQLAPQLVILSF